MKKKVRAVIYLRISQDRDDQTSIENQERECRAYCEQKGWELVGVFQDLGKSGYKPGVKRPGFDNAMTMVQTRQAEVFLVWKVSRFIRRIREFHMFLDVLIKAGGKFDSVTDAVDYATASGELLLAMTAGFAQMESAAKADFARSWNEGRTAKGACPQGPRPLGYDRLSKDDAARDARGNLITLVPNPSESEAIRYAAEQLLAGASLRAIMRDLADFQGTKDTGLTTTGLRSVLVNPTTAGLRAIKEVDEDNPKKKVVTDYVQGCWEPILSRETWEALRTILEAPERRAQTSNVLRHLLSGLMTCGKCGNTFGVRKWKQRGREDHRYTCFNCFNSAAQAVIDDAVKERLLTLVDQRTWKKLKEQGRGYDPAIIKAIEDEQLELAAMKNAGEITLAVFRELNAPLVQRMAQATGATPLDLPDVANLAASWDGMKVGDKRRVLAVVFSQIKLDPANGTRDTVSRLFCRRAV
jgi:DNA invertase Pin-like site-specific DNA recombinase